MQTDRLKEIREAERKSHLEVYGKQELYEGGGWLQKPVKTVLELIPLFASCEELRILDLGAGVGRNCIPFAQAYGNIPCRIECVDILDLAIEKLHDNARKYHVAPAIHGIVKPIEEYEILENSYDLILAISALEHIDTEASFGRKLDEIKRGIRKRGIVCLVLNSDVTERDGQTGAYVPPQFEVNLAADRLLEALDKLFVDWETLKATVQEQQYDIPRESGVSRLKTSVVTYVARRT